MDAPVPDALARFLTAHSPEKITLAYSGGLDSTVLLHVLALLQPRFGFELKAVHVHHGLSRQADRWALHCEQFAQRMGVPCETVRVKVNGAGRGLEDAARRLRYAALAERAQAWVFTAHHRRDQAETVLLNLLRGSGVAGLRGMAEVRALGRGVQLGRPLLGVSHQALLDYAREHGLRWVEDDTNAQLRFRRNWVRHRLLPLLLEKFPAVEAKLAQLAAHMRTTQSLLDELADQDLVQAETEGGLLCQPLLSLSRARRFNALRRWFRQHHGLVLTQAHLEALETLLDAREDASPEVRIGTQTAARFQGRLLFPRPDVPRWPATAWGRRARLPFRFQGDLPDDVLLVPFCETTLTIKPYKKAFQAAGIPPWQRPQWPVACRHGQPAYILGVGPVKEAPPWPEAARVQVAANPAIG